MPITITKIRELARRNLRSPEEEAEAFRKAIKDLSVLSMPSLDVLKTSMKGMFISPPDFGLTSLVSKSSFVSEALSLNDYTRDLLSDMADLAERWKQLKARAKENAEVLGLDINDDAYGDLTVDEVEEGAQIARELIRIGNLREPIRQKLMAVLEPEIEFTEYEQVILRINVFMQGGQRGPKPNIELVINIGGGWEDEKQKPPLRQRSLPLYCTDIDKPVSTVSDRARQYRDIFGDMPSKKARELVARIKLSE